MGVEKYPKIVYNKYINCAEKYVSMHLTALFFQNSAIKFKEKRYG
jgi:hypothetical protein